MKIDVLYEDNHLIAVFKPSGVLTQGDKTGDENLIDEVKKYLKEKYQKPGNVFLGLLHRLDRPVSGIILFAKTSKGAARLSEQFRNHSIVKIYHAVVIGKPEQKRGALVNFLDKDARQKLKHFDGPALIPAGFRREKIIKTQVVKEGQGQLAELYFEVVISNDKYSLLKIQLKTGRFHQIRAQLAHAGFPILGDLKYGPPSSFERTQDFGEASAPFFPTGSIALAATYLSFETATTKEQKEIAIPLPKEWEEYIK